MVTRDQQQDAREKGGCVQARTLLAARGTWNTARNVAISGSGCLACRTFLLYTAERFENDNAAHQTTLRPSPRAFAYTTISR
jgi:hypothetical protein